jgi:hypothetical protein
MQESRELNLEFAVTVGDTFRAQGFLVEQAPTRN